jgi:predicted nucleic acid-binding protein
LLGYHNIAEFEKNEIENYCKDSGRINVDKGIIKEIIYLRNKYKLKTPDAIICGTAFAYDLVLVTNDKKLLAISEIRCLTFENLIDRLK